MKLRAALTAVAIAASAAAQEPFTYETPAWLFAAGDFGELTGDGLPDVALVDRSTGTLHIGFQRVDGGFEWAAPEPTGMIAPTGLALGSFAPASARQVAVTGAADNRVSLFTPTDPGSAPGIRHVFPSWPSPARLAGFEIDHSGGDDLIVFGDAGGGQFFTEFLHDLDTAPASLWGEAGPTATAHAWTFNRKLGEAPVLAAVNSGTFLTTEPGPSGLGSPLALAGFSALPETLMTYGYFNGGSLARVILYTPGQLIAVSSQVTEPSPGAFGWSAVTSLVFPKPLQLVVTIPTAAGARLGVLYTDGSAAIFDFDGVTLTQRSALPGTGHELLLPVGDDSLLSLNAGLWQRWNTAPVTATLVPENQGPMPPVSAATSVSNIIFVSGEPLVDPDATPVYYGHLRDWTLAATGGGSSWSVTALTRSGDGLGDPVTLPYQVPSGAGNALPNQIRPNVSIRSLGPSAGPPVGDVIISPPAGNYPPLAPGGLFPLSFSSTQAAAAIFFRSSPGAAWVLYDPAFPPSLGGAATVAAYARFSSGQSPIRSAAFTFTAPSPLAIGASVDADNDGLPDQWEQAFNAHDPNGDEDGDGVTNLDEFHDGTDPRDPLGTSPAPPQLLASIVGSGTSRVLRLEWPLTDTLSVLQTSEELSSWTEVAAGLISATATHFRHDVSLANPVPARRFYRLARP